MGAPMKPGMRIQRLSFLLAALYLIMASQPARAAITVITQDTLESWITNGTKFDFILIDVRRPGEIDSSGCIATDSCRPYNFNVVDGSLNAVIPKIPATMPVAVYCQSGGRAATAATKLDSAGILHVYRMGTGFGTWPYAKEDSSFVKPSAELPQPSMRTRSLSIVERSVLAPSGRDVAAWIVAGRRGEVGVFACFSLLGRAIAPGSGPGASISIDVRNSGHP
jgi:rhodanese-related sulfurtransferase